MRGAGHRSDHLGDFPSNANSMGEVPVSPWFTPGTVEDIDLEKYLLRKLKPMGVSLAFLSINPDQLRDALDMGALP